MKPRFWPISAFSIVSMVLISVSCSDNPAVRLRYHAEKKFYAAEKARESTLKQSGQITASGLSELTLLYRECIEFCYGALDSIDASTYPVEHNEVKYVIHQASFRLWELFFSAGQFDSSIAAMDRLMRTVDQDENQLMRTCINLGQSLQAAGLWDSARTIFNFAIEEFYPPLDNLGELVAPAFNLPAHIYRVVSTVGDSAAAAREFRRAEEYYRRLISDYPQTKLENFSHLALAKLYEESGQWRKELEELRTMADSAAPGYREAMMRIADLLGGPAREYDSALSIYDDLLETLGATDSAMAPVIKFKTAIVRMDQRKYEEARRIIVELKQDYPRFYDTTPGPQYALARSLEREGNWDRAESEYSLLIEKYRGTDEAMMAHLYMVDYLKKQGRTAESQLWSRTADEHFDDVAFRRRGTLSEAKALLYKAELRRRNRDFDGSAEVLLSVFNKFPYSEPGRRAIAAAANMYRKELRDPAKADSLMEVLRRYLANTSGGVENPDLFTD